MREQRRKTGPLEKKRPGLPAEYAAAVADSAAAVAKSAAIRIHPWLGRTSDAEATSQNVAKPSPAMQVARANVYFSMPFPSDFLP